MDSNKVASNAIIYGAYFLAVLIGILIVYMIYQYQSRNILVKYKNEFIYVDKQFVADIIANKNTAYSHELIMHLQLFLKKHGEILTYADIKPSTRLTTIILDCLSRERSLIRSNTNLGHLDLDLFVNKVRFVDSEPEIVNNGPISDVNNKRVVSILSNAIMADSADSMRRIKFEVPQPRATNLTERSML